MAVIAEPIRTKLQWLTALRVIVVTVFLGLFLALSAGPANQGTSRLFAMLIVGTYALTIVYALALKWINPRWDVLVAVIQLGGDFGCITAVVATTGGIESPFTFLYPIAIITATMVLGRNGGLASTAAAATVYAAFAWTSIGQAGVATWWMQRGVLAPVLLRVLAFVAVFLLSNHLVAAATRATQRLEERESGFRALSAFHENIVQSMSSGLFTADLEGRITSFNTAGYAIFAVSPSEVLGRPCWELFGWEQGAAVYAPLAERGVPYRFERESVRPDGRRLLLGMTLSWLKDSDGAPVGMVGIFQDLTEIKALEERVHQRERLASVGELAAGLAHEIRNPMAAISGAMEVLQQDLRLDGEHQMLMGIAVRETERLNGLIGQFLLYARPSAPHKRACDVVAVVRETLALLRTHHDFREDIEVTEHYPDAPVWGEADANQLRQVVWNLVLNALQAMPHGGRLGVALRVGEAPEPMIELMVTDTGCGVRPDDLHRMFLPFFTTKPGGSGLGLAIVHRIVEEHRGHVDVQSEPAKGTQVVVTLPSRTAGSGQSGGQSADVQGLMAA